MGKKMIVYISGTSGVGKNTVINALKEKDKNIKHIVSYTTRSEMRPNEINGVHYHFITKEEFDKLLENNEILEYDVIHGNYMGHGLKTIEKDFETYDVVMKDLTYKGVEKAKEVVGDKYAIVTVFLTEKKKVLKERLVARGEKNIKLRLSIYKKEQKLAEKYDYIIRNREVDETAKIMQTIMKHEQKGKILLPTETCQTISHDRIEKIEERLQKGKKVKPILIGTKDDKLYILKGRHEYLASLKCGIQLPKVMQYDVEFDALSKEENAEWTKIVKNYSK